MSTSETKAIRVTDPRVVYLPTSSIHPDPDNLKQHPEIQLSHIVASIQKFGFLDPIAVDARGMIIEGHGRWYAANRLGMQTVPVVEIAHLSDAERRAYAIAHNQLTLLTPLDNGIVYDEFQRLGVEQGDWEPLGFTAEDAMVLAHSVKPVIRDQGGWKAPSPKVHKTPMVFDTETQKLEWGIFVERLRDRYPNCLTVGERLLEFAKEFPPAPADDFGAD